MYFMNVRGLNLDHVNTLEASELFSLCQICKTRIWDYIIIGFQFMFQISVTQYC